MAPAANIGQPGVAPLPSARPPLGARPRATLTPNPTGRAVGRLGLVVGLATVLCHPLLYSASPIPLWTPALGIALALVAWVGPGRAAAVLGGAAVALLLRQLLVPGVPAGWAVLEVGLLVAEPLIAWWLYHGRAGGARRLGGPRSATLFVCLVPMAVAATAAAVRLAASLWLLPASADPLGLTFARLWLDHALGFVIVAPLLLVLFTPWLTQRVWAVPEPARRRSEDPESAVVSSPDDAGVTDWVEIAVLSLAASAMCLMLGWLHQRRELLGWQLWGLQLL